ncbi:MAG: hypothetical protein FJ290_06075 [Planctomycetes bacterium]|nr:hypothetical protein [Planctomycetota bacterium]
MATRVSTVGCVCMGLVCALAAVCRGEAPDDAKKKAERVSSYVNLAETITRIGLQVGGMLAKHPYDKALCQYAKELGALHAKAITRLTPPEGAEGVHDNFKEAVANFALCAEAHSAGDFPKARMHREKCVKEFNRTLLEVIKLRQSGVIP